MMGKHVAITISLEEFRLIEMGAARRRITKTAMLRPYVQPLFDQLREELAQPAQHDRDDAE